MKSLFLIALLLAVWRASAEESATPVQQHGWLRVKDGQLCGQNGEPAQLRGMSSYFLQRFPFGSNTVANLAQDWRASVVRAAFYVGGRRANPAVTNAVNDIVEQALRAGVYVIVDWHTLMDGDPRHQQTNALYHLENFARRYGANPNVLFEICNEPNGTNVTWKEITEYANFIIPPLRAIAPKNIIVVGTDTWSQGVRAAAEAPLPYSNIVYTLHFYAGTHREKLRANAGYALSKELPIFVSEWGLTDATGGGPLYTNEGEVWMRWMNTHKISWANWSFSPTPEGSAALVPGTSMNGPWPDSDLTPSGKWIGKKMRSGGAR